MSTKKILKDHTAAEIADVLVLPVTLSESQQKKADKQLKQAREKAQSELSDIQRLTLNLMQLKFQIDDYLNSDQYDSNLTFSYFLKEYVNMLDKKRRVFAKEIDIDETELSQLINQHRYPSENIVVRLEIHSNNAIPALSWYRLVEKEKEYALQTNTALRRKEQKNVTNRIAVEI